MKRATTIGSAQPHVLVHLLVLLRVLLLVLALAAVGACRKSADLPPTPRSTGDVAAATPPAGSPAPEPGPSAAPDVRSAPAAAEDTSRPASSDVAAAAPDAHPETAPAADVAPDTGGLAPYQIEAQAEVLRTPRDVLEVFLTTREPRLRHALLTADDRAAITAKGLHAFYEGAPGLLDLPLPLETLSYELAPAPGGPGGPAGIVRFEVRRSAPPDDGTRRAAYYTLREEDGRARLVWDRRDVALARLLVAKGAYAEAETAARQILARSPVCGDCAEVLFWAQSRREGGRAAWKKAGEHARRAVEWEPAVAEHWNALGVYRRNVREYGRAREAFQRALELDPRSEAAGNLALLLEHEGREAEALAAIDAYVAREPEELWAHLTRCRVLAGLDRREEARAACEKALALRQEADEAAHVAEAHYRLARLLADAGEREAALAQAEKALEARPGYWIYAKFKEELQRK